MPQLAIERGDESNITLQDIARYNFVLPYVKNKKVLDIACGTGYGTVKMHQDGNVVEVWGVDIDGETIKNNCQRYKNYKNLFFLQSTGYNLPFEDNKFDTVVSIETLEHLDRPNEFLAELKRVTKINGIIIISTPLNNTAQRFHPSNPFHLREYNKQELSNMLFNYFSEFELFYQTNTLKKNWLTKTSNRLLRPSSLMRRFLKKLIPEYFLSSVRVILGASKDITIKSEINKSEGIASVIIAVIQNK